MSRRSENPFKSSSVYFQCTLTYSTISVFLNQNCLMHIITFYFSKIGKKNFIILSYNMDHQRIIIFDQSTMNFFLSFLSKVSIQQIKVTTFGNQISSRTISNRSISSQVEHWHKSHGKQIRGLLWTVLLWWRFAPKIYYSTTLHSNDGAKSIPKATAKNISACTSSQDFIYIVYYFHTFALFSMDGG